MKAKALLALAVHLVHLSTASNIIGDDIVRSCADLPNEIQAMILDRTFMATDIHGAISYADYLKGKLNTRYITREKEMQLLAQLLPKAEIEPVKAKARIEEAIGRIAVKLCVDRILDEHVYQDGESGESVFKSLRTLVDYPNLDSILPKVVIDLLDEVTRTMDKPLQLLNEQLSAILLPFAKGNFEAWYAKWTEEDKMNYTDAVKEALLKAGKLVLFKEMGGKFDRFAVERAIEYRCRENDWQRLQILRYQIFGYKVDSRICFEASIMHDATKVLKNLLEKEKPIVRTLCDYASYAVSHNSPLSFAMLSNRMLTLRPDVKYFLSISNHLPEKVISSRNMEIFNEAVKNRLLQLGDPSLLTKAIDLGNLEVFKIVLAAVDVNSEDFKSRISGIVRMAVINKKKDFIEYLLQRDEHDPSKNRFGISLTEQEWQKALNVHFLSIEPIEYLFDPNGNSPIPRWPQLCLKLIKQLANYAFITDVLEIPGGHSSRFDNVLKAVFAANEKGELKNEYLKDLDYNPEEIYRTVNPLAIPVFMKYSKVTGNPLIPKLDIFKNLECLDRSEVRASIMSLEVMGEHARHSSVEANLYEDFLRDAEKVNELKEMCEFWNRARLTSIYADKRFEGIDHRAGEAIARIAQTNAPRHAIFTHFTSFVDSKPRYPNLRLPRDFLFTANITVYSYTEILGHHDRRGNLYFGLSLWNGDLHFIGRLAASAGGRNLAHKFEAENLTRKILKIKTDGSFVLKEMTVEVLEDCIAAVKALPNPPRNYLNLIESKLQDIRHIHDELNARLIKTGEEYI